MVTAPELYKNYTYTPVLVTFGAEKQQLKVIIF